MTKLEQLVADELAHPVDARVAEFAAAIAEPYRATARAVLFYGSCLRTADLVGQMLDFYLVVSDYDAAYDVAGKPAWMARANRLLPPNVFPATHGDLVAKVAVLSAADFTRLNTRDASAVSVWARFAQPSRLAWRADTAAGRACVEAIAQAPVTLLDGALAHAGDGVTLGELWECGFALTYAAELRAERAGRSRSVVEFAPDWYTQVGLVALSNTTIRARMDNGVVAIESGQQALIAAERARWPQLRRNGKLLTLARLAKASATYADGIDYLAWKINRHADTDYRIKPWQRRHPLLGALTLLPRMWRSGAIR